MRMVAYPGKKVWPSACRRLMQASSVADKATVNGGRVGASATDGVRRRFILRELWLLVGGDEPVNNASAVVAPVSAKVGEWRAGFSRQRKRAFDHSKMHQDTLFEWIRVHGYVA